MAIKPLKVKGKIEITDYVYGFEIGDILDYYGIDFRYSFIDGKRKEVKFYQVMDKYGELYFIHQDDCKVL